MVKGLGPGNIRITRVSSRIKGSDLVAVERVARQSAIRKTSGIRAYLRDLHKVRAVITLTTLDLKAVLVSGVVRPRQIDLT